MRTTWVAAQIAGQTWTCAAGSPCDSEAARCDGFCRWKHSLLSIVARLTGSMERRFVPERFVTSSGC